MRSSVVALAGVVLLAGRLPAQAPQQQPPQQPSPQQNQPAPALNPADPLDSVLLQWEQKMTQVNSLGAQIIRQKEDRVFHSNEVYEGVAYYLKPNYAILDLHRKDKPAVFEKFISTGTLLYEFYQAQQEVRWHQLPPPKAGQVANDNFLSFLFGMRAAEAKQRYDIKLKGQDNFYYYLEVAPRFPADKQDFQQARIALTKSTLMPRQLTFDEPNGNRITWDIPGLQVDMPLKPSQFDPNPLPPGWKMVRAPAAGQGGAAPGNPGASPPPRVIRPQK